jgi:hypothetical protein
MPCISSSTRPFVSGTNKTAEPHMPDNMKNVPGVVLPKNYFKYFFLFKKRKCQRETGPVRNSVPLSIAIG